VERAGASLYNAVDRLGQPLEGGGPGVRLRRHHISENGARGETRRRPSDLNAMEHVMVDLQFNRSGEDRRGRRLALLGQAGHCGARRGAAGRGRPGMAARCGVLRGKARQAKAR
jgi:hypothetical protein